jgi:N-methylhydantoinase A
LEIRRLRMPELYNLLYEKPVPLVPRYLRREALERLGPHGELILPLDESHIRSILCDFEREGVESIAVCFINSYADGKHERRVGEIAAETVPRIPCSLSCEILPEVREYERTSTTVINAYVRPIVERYLHSLLSQLKRVGLSAPVLVMQSNGGILSVRTAMEKPVHMVESGPAAGVVAARLVAKRAGIDHAIAFDMGGTTAKASMIAGGKIQVTSEFEVGTRLSSTGINLAGGGYVMKVPVIDISEVGAGGGSIIWIDRGGSLQVGPRSAGSVPGPACYALGGTEATVTDANVVLGYLNPCYLAGGSLPIDASRSLEAIENQVARPLRLSLQEAALAAHMVANVRMVGAIKAISTQRGQDPRKSALIAFGGNGPVHAPGIAALLEMKRIVVPPAPGLFSAFGLLWADHEHHAVRTYYRPFQHLDLNDLNEQFGYMESKALSEFASEGYGPERVRLNRFADIRYVGQGFELTIPVPGGMLQTSSLAALEETFAARHQETYGHRSDGDPLQFVNLRLTALGQRLAEPAVGRDASHASGYAKSASTRDAYFHGFGILTTPLLSRNDLAKGGHKGPFIIEEYDATVVVPPGWIARADSIGNVIISEKETR